MSVFNGLEYIASYRDLIAAFGANKAAGESHYNSNGRSEGRVVSFDGLEYIASYADLSAAFGPNEDAGAAHYIQTGQREGRVVTFDGLEYIASYADLRTAFGANGDAGSIHFITSGRAEGRVTTFDGLEYIASYCRSRECVRRQLRRRGRRTSSPQVPREGRDSDSFSAYHYLHNYADLEAAFGNNVEAATSHYITNGRLEGRTDAALDAWAGPAACGSWRSGTRSPAAPIRLKHRRLSWAAGSTVRRLQARMSTLSGGLQHRQLCRFAA